MKWYYQRQGSHTHVRVFMNGAKCGDLCFTNEEFEYIQVHYHLLTVGSWLIQFIAEAEPEAAKASEAK
jgi:hypothetical protein